jgi:glycine cleavage system aminomethyltransferase T
LGDRLARRQLLGRHLRLLPDPARLGYWGFVKFDHDFIGRAALEAMDAEGPGAR